MKKTIVYCALLGGVLALGGCSSQGSKKAADAATVAAASTAQQPGMKSEADCGMRKLRREPLLPPDLDLYSCGCYGKIGRQKFDMECSGFQGTRPPGVSGGMPPE